MGFGFLNPGDILILRLHHLFTEDPKGQGDISPQGTVSPYLPVAADCIHLSNVQTQQPQFSSLSCFALLFINPKLL